jgi:2-oxo-4-hydroxy-4-carboxy--5-ureidoimidazoline (OHCU) decarboxylase
MDLNAVAAAAVSLIAPYFAKAGSMFAKEAGKHLSTRIGELFKAIKDKFQSDDYAMQTLDRVKAKPNLKSRKTVLREVLSEKMEEDARFANLINQLVREIKTGSEDSQGDLITQHLDISGKAGNVFQVGKIQGDITSIRGDANVTGDKSEAFADKKID